MAVPMTFLEWKFSWNRRICPSVSESRTPRSPQHSGDNSAHCSNWDIGLPPLARRNSIPENGTRHYAVDTLDLALALVSLLPAISRNLWHSLPNVPN
jgi:hypothetical protein